SSFALGGLQCVVADGACWLADKSALAGSAARMIDLVRTLMTSAGVPLAEAVSMASTNPARAIGCKNKGTIAAGADADFTVFSPEFQVLQTFVGGEQVFPKQQR
ncbi:MAG: amidohydrolase family protein, partial [Verrucomicrobiota bacterium]|nr:amidohydrolase family protein [Verrucomicrobiota bacterium]